MWISISSFLTLHKKYEIIQRDQTFFYTRVLFTFQRRTPSYSIFFYHIPFELICAENFRVSFKCQKENAFEDLMDCEI